MKILTASVIAACFAPFGTASAYILIDNFSDAAGTSGSIVVINKASPPVTPVVVTQSQSGLMGVIGGSRRISIVRQSTIGNSDRRITGTVTDFGSPIFEYDSTSGADGAVDLGYGFSAALNADFSLEKFIDVRIEDYDFPGSTALSASLRLESPSGSKTVTGSFAQSGSGDLRFSLSDFTGVNLKNISLINLRLDPPRGSDFEIQSIAATGALAPIPETSTLLPLGTLFGLSLAFRRRSR